MMAYTYRHVLITIRVAVHDEKRAPFDWQTRAGGCRDLIQAGVMQQEISLAASGKTYVYIHSFLSLHCL